MLSIGQVSRSSGLTPTALRFYDREGLLVPRHVEDGNGYRRYAPGQLRDAVTISVLRRMGMPLDRVRELRAAPDRCAELLERFAADVAAQHAAQVAAITRGRAVLASYAHLPAVRERDAAAQHWVGAVERVDFHAEPAPQQVHEGDRAFPLLHRALTEAGRPPVGVYWNEVRPDADGRSGRFLRCWPVAGPVGEGFAVPGLLLEHGVLPPRREAFVPVLFDDPEIDGPELDDPELDGPAGADPGRASRGGAVPHIGEIALAEHLQRVAPDLDLGGPATTRQVGLFGEVDAPVGFELVVTVAVSNGPG